MSLVLGVDPGLTGGLALLGRAGQVVAAEAMPVLRNTVPTIDARALGAFLRAAQGEEVFAYVERAQAFPRMAVSSVFNYGVVFGAILQALHDLDIGIEFVQAAKWKRDLGLTSDKGRSIDRVRLLYPTLPMKKSEDGIAEAILIARWGAGIRGA